MERGEVIEKNAVLGEILYIGFVFEKGRCKSDGIWKYSYIRSLKKHIILLEKVAKCMQTKFQIERDNLFLKKIYYEIEADIVLKSNYPFCKLIEEEEILIKDCQDENQHLEINNLIIKMLEDILVELNKGMRKDKEKITRIIFSLHNLPRVYLKKGIDTLFMLNQNGISSEEALLYSKLSMDENMLSIYEHFFTR